ncbi:MAG: Rrf2 family transcriptional regulator [Acidobacteria bacterium]|nr:Rrf2 family transcriptional regulator [Acidobacteriota bacterium]
MIYSRSAEYAIRAFVRLASVPEGKYAMVKQIAEEGEIPSHFLAKILQQLARKGFLRSSKGPTGGFCLRIPAKDLSLLNIVDAVDGLADFERCPAGMAECNDQAPCGMHDSWKAMRNRIIEYLERTSIEDLAKGFDQKRKNLEKAAKKAAKRTATKKA